MITVQLLGGACLRSGDVVLSGPPAQRHRIALLALVAASWPQSISRERAMTLLWPERDLANGRRLLNLAVHVLRAAVGENAIVSTVDGLLLNPLALTCDLHQLRAAVASQDHESVVRLYKGPMLDGFHLDDAQEFSYWLDEHRNEIEHAYVGALLWLAEKQEQAGDAHEWVGICRRLTAVDPHSAVYAQMLMRALAAAGDAAGVAQHVRDYTRRMRMDFEMEPDPAVAALALQLRNATTTRRPAMNALAPSRSASVAVLPFVSLNSDEDDFFADGITEDVIAHLSKIRALKVIARGSVMRFKNRQQTIKQIASALGVTTVLDGSVRRVGDRVRIVATVVDVQTDQHLWVETYDRQMTDIFSIQTDVALQIAAALKATLSPDEHSRVRKEPTKDLQAYQLFLQGRGWYIKFTPDAYGRAIEYFNRAVARDPGFALAWANLAMLYSEFAEMGVTDPHVAYERANEAASTALSLDPELGAAYSATGYLKFAHEFDWAGAELDFKRALELNPSGADAYDLYGRLCAAVGRYDEAIALLLRARELDPLAHRLDIVTALLRAGRYEEAVIEAEAAWEFDHDYDRASATLGWAYFLSGKREEGIAELERTVRMSPQNTLWLGQLGGAYAMDGNDAKARQVLRELEVRERESYVSPYHFAYVYTGLGELDTAVELLERAVAARTGPVYSIKGSFLLTPLQAHPRFRALLRQMNLDYDE